MNDVKVYLPVWNKYMPVIVMKLKSALKKNEVQSFGMDKLDFENAGNRKNASYQFELEMKEGLSLKTKKNSAVSRDFVQALNDNETAKSLIKTGHFRFYMSNKFLLTIEARQPAIPE